MTNKQGDTAIYLMYDLVRRKSILRKVPNLDSVLDGEIILDSDEARKLAFKILKYSEIITDAVREFSPHHLCKYLYDLVFTLNMYYDKWRCLEFNDAGTLVQIHGHRVRLIQLALFTISKIFHLVGLEEIEEI